MGKEIVIEAEAWAEFEDLLVRNEHQGGDRVVKEVSAHFQEHGWMEWWPKGNKFQQRDRIIALYRNWMGIRYSQHRRNQLLETNYRFWIYRHGNSLDPRPSHVAWDGVALPPDHPFWDLHFPPCGWGCTCRVSGADSERGIVRLGGDPERKLPEGWDAPLPETGRPLGVDWQYKYGQRWPTLLEIVEAVVSGKHPYI